MFVVSQAEEHPLFLQHHPGGAHLARLHRPIPDGQKHLVFRGEPLLQIPLLLQSLLHHEIMRLGEGGRQQSGGRRNEEVLVWMMRGAGAQSPSDGTMLSVSGLCTDT